MSFFGASVLITFLGIGFCFVSWILSSMVSVFDLSGSPMSLLSIVCLLSAQSLILQLCTSKVGSLLSMGLSRVLVYSIARKF